MTKKAELLKAASFVLEAKEPKKEPEKAESGRHLGSFRFDSKDTNKKYEINQEMSGTWNGVITEIRQYSDKIDYDVKFKKIKVS